MLPSSHRCLKALRFAVLFLLLAVLLGGCATAGNSGGGGGDNPPVVISTTSLPNGQVGSAYNVSLAASGGKVPYTWSLMSGILPAGLTLNDATGAITGTPTASVASAPLRLEVTDSNIPTQSKSVSLTLTISPAPLQITTASLPSGQVGAAYSTTLAASGGTTPYSW
ncbi:MAG TPA: Ig domain-containing protein, partial [Candidatus Acidoferrum sp.]